MSIVNIRLILVVCVFFGSIVHAESLHGLKKLGIMVLVPSSVPEGFKLTSVETFDTEYKDKKYPEYQLTYCDEKKKCFSVESASGEKSEPPDGDPVKASSPLLGEFTINYLKAGKDGNSDKEDYIVTSWMPDAAQKKALREKKPPGNGRFHHVVSNGLSVDQVKKIVQSFKPLPRAGVK